VLLLLLMLRILMLHLRLLLLLLLLLLLIVRRIESAHPETEETSREVSQIRTDRGSNLSVYVQSRDAL
jgi:hypothetical protein